MSRRSIPSASFLARTARITCSLGLAIVGVGACTSTGGLSSGDDPFIVPDGGPSAHDACTAQLDSDHDNCGACGMKCAADQHCLAGKCAPGCPDHAVFVSADGNDNASGCTVTTPKRTIGAALALLKTLGAQKHEVRVCRGTYEESVALDYAASLAGGFECATWKRSAGYGYPTFDAVNETVVTGSPAASPITVTGVQGVVIEGITFRAQDGSATRIPGALAKDGARPTFSHSRIIGGGGDIPISPASVGIALENGGSAEISRCSIEGGRARNTTAGGYGSAGLFLATNAGNAHVVESTIDGGAGVVSGGTGSVGVLGLGGSLGGGGIERSAIRGGSGRTAVGSAAYGIGFFTGAAVDVEVSGSLVHGGLGRCSGACSVNGVALRTAGKVKLHGNRIHGGEVDQDLVDDIGYTGIRLSEFSSADVQNNAVFSGNSTNIAFSSGSVALALDSTNGTAIVANNTLVVGPTEANKGTVLVAKSKTATVANNLFMSAGSNASDRVVALDACASRSYSLHGNAWAGFAAGTPLLRADTGASTCATDGINASTADGIASSAATAFGGANVTGNVRITSACAGDARCTTFAACSSSVACLSAMTSGTFDLATAGKLLESGWKLPSTAPCSVAKGGVQVTGIAEVDAFGAARTAPRSIGAHESESCQ